MTLPEVLRRVVSILNEESVAYMVTGSFATAYYAHPRATQDIDLVVEASEDALERVAARLKEAGYYVSPEAVREAVELCLGLRAVGGAGGVRPPRPPARGSVPSGDRRAAACVVSTESTMRAAH